MVCSQVKDKMKKSIPLISLFASFIFLVGPCKETRKENLEQEIEKTVQEINGYATKYVNDKITEQGYVEVTDSLLLRYDSLANEYEKAEKNFVLVPGCEKKQ